MDHIDEAVPDQTGRLCEAVSADQPEEFEMPVAELAELGFQQNMSPESAVASRGLGQLIYDLAPEQCPDGQRVQLVVVAAEPGKVPQPEKNVRFYFRSDKPQAEMGRIAMRIAGGELPLHSIREREDYYCDTCVAPGELIPAIRSAIPVLREALSRRRSVADLTR